MKALILLLFSTGAFAQATTYTFTGQQMTVTVTGQAREVPIPQDLSGYVTLAQPLAPNAANQVVTPTAFSFGGTGWLSTGNPGLPPFATQSFIFSTRNGVITDWSIYLQTGDIGGKAGAAMYSSAGGDTYEAEFACCDVNLATSYEGVNAENVAAGAWTYPGEPPPPPDPLQAQVTSLQSQVSTLTTQRNSYLNGYLAANATVARQTTYIIGERELVAALNAQVAKCRANQGKC